MSTPFNRRVPMFPQITYVDKYPRGPMPGPPGVTRQLVRSTPQESPRDPGADVANMADIFRQWRVRPQQRPIVYQRKLNIAKALTAVPVPIMDATFICETFVVCNPFANAQSVYYGSNGVNLTNGYEIRPGLPVAFTTDNTRQLWEVQTGLEDIAALLAGRLGIEPTRPELSPRVVFDMNDQYLVSPAANQTVAVMFFMTPELQ